MIEILHKEDCCGCEACRQCCPHRCISMKKDEEGFLYPITDKTKCVECGLCERVCPVLNPYDEHLPISISAFTHSDESIRMNSSSGGFFTKIATAIIEQGGVVFGACFDEEWRVVHTYIDKKEKLPLLQGSKYVQSSIGDSYISAKRFLQDGVPVLFTGTSCQIAGLKRFLRKDYDLLYTMDVICHGVPSPLVWKDYLHSISSVSDIESISFRNKSTGWKNYSFSLKKKDHTLFVESHAKNLYMKGFLNDFFLRPSCYNCHFKKGTSGSDFIIGDFWGVDKIFPVMDDDKGASVVLIYSKKGEGLYKQCGLIEQKIRYSDILKYNRCLEKCVAKEWYSNLFWSEYSKHGIIAMKKVLDIKYNISKLKRLYYKITTNISSIINK